MPNNKTEDIALNIEYSSPSTLSDLRWGYDANFSELDDLFPVLFAGLDAVDYAFSQTIDLEESGE